MPTFRGDNMEKSIKNFIDYLEEVYEKLDRNKKGVRVNKIKQVEDRLIIQLDSVSPKNFRYSDEIQTEIGHILRILKTPEDEIEMRKEVFDDFSILSAYLQMTDFSIHDIYQIITFFINRNIKLCITENSITIDMNVLKKMKFETIDIKDLFKKISDGEINDFFNSDEEELTELEKMQIKELNRRMPEFTRDLNAVRKHTLNFEKHILNKMPNILLDDIMEAKIALRGLKCSEYIVDKIVLYLLKVYEKNLHNLSEVIDIDLTDVYINVLFPLSTDEEGKVIKDGMYSKNMYHKNLIRNHNKGLEVKNKPQEPKKEEKKYLTEADVRELNKFIRKFYSLYNIEIISIPNYEELLELIEDMEKLEVKPLEITRYLSKLLDSPELPDNLITTQQELLTITNKLIKYKVSGIEIAAFIRRYRSNFRKTYENSIAEYLDRVEEIKFYDATIESDLSELYETSLSADQENYLIIVSMIQEYLDMLSKYNLSVDYEYNLAKNLK